MKYCHNLEVRVFSRKGEDEEVIKKVLISLFPFDMEKEKVQVKTETVTSYEGDPIKILSVFVKKQTLTTQFVENLFSKLSPEEKELLNRQLSSRLDERLHFYLRLDKGLLMNGEYLITDSGNCFHINLCLACYPHRREVAKEIMWQLLK
jgi:RNA binding exosome subunit